jgi:hypothetical protein
MQKRIPKIVIPVLLAAVVVLGAVVYFRPRSAPPADPGADRFELLQVTAAPAGDHYAGVYRYFHANSASTVGAVWVGSGTPPAIGSKEPAAGEPSLVFTGDAESLHVDWPSGSSRPAVEVAKLADVKKGPAAIEDCYFSEARSTNLVCYDAKAVDLQ